MCSQSESSRSYRLDALSIAAPRQYDIYARAFISWEVSETSQKPCICNVAK